MAFNNDLIGANLLQGGAQGFIQGMRDAEDSKYKKLEFDAKMKANDEQRERQKLETAIAMRKNHMAMGDDGNITDTPLSAEEAGEQSRKDLVEHGYNSKYDPSTRTWTSKVDPESLKAKTIMAKASAGNMSMDVRKDTIDRREHEKVLGRLAQNKNIQARLNQYQNLGNALATIEQAEHVTPQQVQEFQQAVRANLGIKGSSAVGEREATQINTMGLNAANMMQFLSGDPASLSKDSNLMRHLKDLAAVEQRNIRKQFDATLNAATGGHKSMYDRRPDLMADLQDALDSQKAQIGLPEPIEQGGGGMPSGPAQAGSEGLLSKGWGMLKDGIMGNGQKPAPAENFAPDVMKYASEHGLTPQQAQAIKDKRMAGKK